MVRELAITLYLLLFRLFFNIFKLFPQKQKATFVSSFGDNILYTVNQLEKESDDDIVILKTKQCKIDFEVTAQRKILLFELTHALDWVRSIYHLATSQVIFIDNYFGFLGVSKFKPNVKCIQLWHAAGAIKQFGLVDPSVKERSQQAKRRFEQVYNRFTHVVVGSEKMSDIFHESFGLGYERMLRTGIPRTDFYFDIESMENAIFKLNRIYPIIQRKKVLLYAPTFRDETLNSAKIVLDINRLHHEFKNEYVLLLRLHPAIQGVFKNQYPEFVIDVSDYPDIHHLLVVTDVLVTDYSSIPFEFSLLDRPMVFFAYDLEEYEDARGFWEDYESLVPGPVVRDTESIVNVIKDNLFDYERIQVFAEEWNEYSDGASSKRLIDVIYERERGVSE